MADETKATQAVNEGATQEVAQQSEAQVVEEQERFDTEYVRKLRAEAADYRKRLRELESKVRADEEAKLTEQERLQKRLVELERKETEYQMALQARTLEYEVKLHAARLGVVDPEAAYRLLDLKQIEFDEDGKPMNLEKVLKELVTKKPYLVGATNAASPMNPAQGRVSGQQVFTRSQLRDPKFFAANREAIMQAMREGRILED
ncbi:MAG: phage scaffolding protein [Anaerolineales bacterium]